ncbi:MAG: helix-hairpin-helix domain-containing protein, partial [Deltaproteobacteria bacterium]|nr:helix-hairpin-helix domain-containing protein [Deltaproteobacteria bacterium]
MRKTPAWKPYLKGVLFTVVAAAALAMAAGSALAAGAPVDINTADQKAIESLPGVGPATAKAIIQGRPYKIVHALVRPSLDDRLRRR